MGGFGSGRHPWSSRNTVERFRSRTISIEINDWVERGLVRPGNVCRLEWLDKDGCPEASIAVRIDTVRVLNEERLRAVLGYQVGPAPEALEVVEEVIMLAGSRCGFRGRRLRFYCPGCGRRVEKLYLNEVYFRCRKCCGLGYRSQRKNREDRGLEKAARIKKHLGGEGDFGEPFPERPKGMHQRTYERLREQAEEGEWPYQERMEKNWQRGLEELGKLLKTKPSRKGGKIKKGHSPGRDGHGRRPGRVGALETDTRNQEPEDPDHPVLVE